MGPRALVNGSFGAPEVPPEGLEVFPDASQQGGVPGWKTLPAGQQIEIWSSGHKSYDKKVYADGDEADPQFAELNTESPSTLFQDLETDPGTTMYWRLKHRGRRGRDTMALLIGAPDKLVKQRQITDDNTAWGEHSGSYTVPAGQTTTRFAFQAVDQAGDDASIGNFLDGIVFTVPVIPLLPSFLSEEDEVVVPKSDVSGTYMVVHHVTNQYLSTNLPYAAVTDHAQLWYADPLPLGKDQLGYLWEFVKVQGNEYRVRAAQKQSTDTKKGDGYAYLEPQDKLANTHQSIMYMRDLDGDDTADQIWELSQVGGSADTFVLVPKKFPGYALATQDSGAGDRYVMLQRVYGKPSVQHYWHLCPGPMTAYGERPQAAAAATNGASAATGAAAKVGAA